MDQLTVKELRNELRKRKIPNYGLKPQLLHRLQTHLARYDASPETFKFRCGTFPGLNAGIQFKSAKEFEDFLESDEPEIVDFEEGERDFWEFPDDGQEEVVQSMRGMSAFDAVVSITKDFDSSYKYLKDMGVLRRDPPACTDPLCNGRKMTLIKWNNLDGCIFRCGMSFKPDVKGGKGKRCNKKISIRAGSYIEGSHLTLKKLILLCHSWALQLSNAKTEKYVGLSPATVVQW